MTELDRMGRDPLHYAAMANDVNTIQQRLTEGVPVDLAEEREGYTPLLFAIQEGAVEATRALLEAGADVHVTTTAGAAWTPLHLAVMRWRANPDGDILRLLVEYNADKTARASNGYTPSDLARGQRKFPSELTELLNA